MANKRRQGLYDKQLKGKIALGQAVKKQEYCSLF
jgi:hypothetical protein